jgi:glycerol-3-phosphate acyltransferase PlsX
MKSKPDASILKCVAAVKSGDAQGIVAFGNTGATVASATLGLRMIPGARRPAIAVNMLGDSGRFVLLDAGANPTPKPAHMLQQAVMGAALARDVLKIENPRIGLLNIGGEAAKGNALLKESYSLLDGAPINFIGNIEGNEIFFGKADVVVADGFSGNTVLKVMEGFSEYLSHQAHAHSQAEGEDFKGTLRKLLGAADYTEVGGAILLGVNGTVLIGHGRSKAKTVLPALRQVRLEISSGVDKHIEESFRELAAASQSPS